MKMFTMSFEPYWSNLSLLLNVVVLLQYTLLFIVNVCCVFQVYSPSPEEFNQDQARYASPKPAGPAMYGEYPYPG